jgi:hypothetical protein
MCVHEFNETQKEIQMSWRFGMVITTAVTLLFALAACQPVRDTRTNSEPVEKTLYVGAELVDCVGVGPMQCMLVKENPEDEYQLFYSEIEGFTFEPGYTYELRVLVEPVANAPADASSLKYTLIEVVSQEPVAAEAADAAGATEPIWRSKGPTWQLDRRGRCGRRRQRHARRRRSDCHLCRWRRERQQRLQQLQRRLHARRRQPDYHARADDDDGLPGAADDRRAAAHGRARRHGSV